MNRKTIPMILATLTSIATGSALLATPASAAKVASKAHTYKGTSVSTSYGPIEVDITVKGKKITNVSVVDPTHTARSAVLASNAIPTLKQEVLSAQSARINTISGATMLSQAYIQSLESALKKAHLG